jgi:hypothetical protein
VYIEENGSGNYALKELVVLDPEPAIESTTKNLIFLFYFFFFNRDY